jgi:hypothetical protein
MDDENELFFWIAKESLVALDKHREGGLPRATVTI